VNRVNQTAGADLRTNRVRSTHSGWSLQLGSRRVLASPTAQHRATAGDARVLTPPAVAPRNRAALYEPIALGVAVTVSTWAEGCWE
jgi:hypothetical protein